MDDIFKILDEATAPTLIGETARKILEKQEPLYNKILELTSREFVDKLWGLKIDELDAELMEHFARGFRLGAQIMLSVLTPAPPD